VVVGLIAVYGAWDNAIAWLYLAMHGTYGLLWLIKSRLFADRSWEREVSLGEGLATWLFLTLYWVAPWLIVSGNGGDPEPWFIGLCVAMYSFGVFLHFASDMQKHLYLRWRPGTLITDGLWGVVRNPNYLGELLIYLGFGLLAVSWIPVAILAFVVAAYWYPNMRRKDRSLSRYPQFADYKARTKLWIPYIA
jgi:protein-S-isoprenylcysteine O-methyltransferase Ste14